ncbi:MAG: protein-glutamate O-methyltransferase CheR [Spirochaetaceae bacterium]|nr:protein-glutamate O-methyltransferase CheR [Spirochaetaceae bacterium]
MPNNEPQGFKEISDKEFKIISDYIEKIIGIKISPSKKVMIQSRLFHRLKKLNFTDYKQYIDYVFNSENSDDELVMMINAITTNKTDFFRETDHFRFLEQVVLPEFVSRHKNNVKIWSAGCSSGEEPYTISMVMEEFCSKNPGKITGYKITGTDISTKVLDKACHAVYPLESVAHLDLGLKKKYFMKNTEKKLVMVKENIRSHVNFKRLNFMDGDFSMSEVYDVIFCRNVLIYFNKETQENVIRKFLRYLTPDGYLFLGHSETILSMNLPLKSCAPAVYKRVLKAD